MQLDVLHCDNHLLVVHKPAGLATVPDRHGEESLFDLARAWVKERYEKPGDVFLGIVHRLDQPVSGVIAFARTSKAAARLSLQFRDRTARKWYWGVCGPLDASRAREGSGVVEQWLLKEHAKNRVRVATAEAPGAKLAVTRWRVLEERDGRTLLELEPLSGRAHQLRACAASLSAPLLGDLKYGARSPLSDKSIALHARRLELEHPTRGLRLSFTAPAPTLEVWDFETCRGG